MSNVTPLVPNPELYKLHEDLMKAIDRCGDVSVAGVIGTLELVKLAFIEQQKEERGS